MGILKVSPDSFAERERLDAASVVDAALRMQDEGADLIDLGGESTRPGAAAVSLEEELSRVRPALDALAGRLRVPLSIDTQKAEVARVAVAEGAAIVNDVTALDGDRRMADTVAASGAALILMHGRGPSREMYARAEYADLLADVTRELGEAVERAERAGIARDRLLIDPGIGFAKRPAHSYGVLAGVPEMAQALGLPILVGPSRKSYLSGALGDRPAVARDWGTAAAVTAAVLAGAHVVRVHAVDAMVQVVRVAEEIRRASASL
jgi:dihydropteroate synthase